MRIGIGIGKAINGIVQELEDIRKEYTNGFESEQIGKRNLSIKGSNSTVDGHNVSSNISHVPYKWSDDLHEDIWPDLFIDWAEIFDVGMGFIQSRDYLISEHRTGHYRQINRYLKNFLQVSTPR